MIFLKLLIVIIFDDSDNNKLFVYKTMNDYVKCKTNGSSNLERNYKNSSFKLNATKICIRYFSRREYVNRVFGFKLKQICRQFLLKFWIMIIYDWCSDDTISCSYFYDILYEIYIHLVVIVNILFRVHSCIVSLYFLKNRNIHNSCWNDSIGKKIIPVKKIIDGETEFDIVSIMNWSFHIMYLKIFYK